MKRNIRTAGLSLGTSLLALLAATMPASAQTPVPPVLQLSDGLGDVVTIDSTGTTTFSNGCACATITPAVAALGSITWSGTVGPFTIYGVNGRSKPALASPDIDLGVGAISTGATGGTLTMSWTDTNFSPGSGPARLNETTTFASGSGSVVYTAYVDNTNTAFGTGILVGTTGPTTGAALITGPGPTMDPFSMTGVEAITMAAGSLFINDFGVIAAPTPPLTQSCPVASGQVGISYTSGMVTNGGTTPYSFTLTGGSLPSGLVLNPSTGAITGTPGTASTYSFTIQVSDSSSPVMTATNTCGITIASPPPTLSCSGLTSGQVGSLYSASLVAMGGVQPYTFSTLSGSLPPGLSLNALTGSISGTPTTSGSYTFTAQVVDSGTPKPNTVTAPGCGITIAPPPTPVLTCSSVTSGTTGTPFSSPALTVTSGTAPFTFSIVGTLPTGLTLNTATGAVTGTPTSAGSFKIQVTDKNGLVAATTCSTNIVATQIVPLSVTCPLGTATAGVPYTSTLTITGGVTPYTITVSAGSLPVGLTLNPTTTSGIVTGATISGTPSTAGTSGFTIKVVDHAGTVATSSCTGTCATGGTASINFNASTGSLGNSHAYLVSGVTVTAYGYTNSGSATALDGQNNSGVQNDGLGISAGSGGQIDTTHFVQLDLGAAVAAGATNFQLMIDGLNQCQNGESYDIYGSNTLGSIGTIIISAGSKDSTFFPVSLGSYRYLSVRAHSGNVLIGQISFTLPGTTCSITVAPAPTPKVAIKKTANVSKVNPFQPVTYTYTVTNTGSFTLTNVVVTDDNATPSYTGDDFTVGTIASLLPGASSTLTATLIPPVSEGGTQQSWNGWGNNGWGNNGWGNNGGSNNTTTAGTLICSKLSNGNYQITYRQDPSQTDNTYGRGSSSSWGGQQRNFTDMLSGQAAEFRFLDANGNTVLDVATDYVSKSSSFPSGYGTLGVKGGNGAVISGSSSHVISCDTTLSHNLNQSSSFYKCTTDSPTSSSWDNVSGYTIVVDGKTFGSAGWGGVAIPECHNQNSIQYGCNDQKVSPVSSQATNTATVTATGNGVTVSATATATVQIDASTSGWSQCSKY